MNRYYTILNEVLEHPQTLISMCKGWDPETNLPRLLEESGNCTVLIMCSHMHTSYLGNARCLKYLFQLSHPSRECSKHLTSQSPHQGPFLLQDESFSFRQETCFQFCYLQQPVLPARGKQTYCLPGEYVNCVTLCIETFFWLSCVNQSFG